MKTWTNYPSGNPATTTWNYNPYRGWLDNKRYPDNQGPSYTYTPAGRLASRTWARGVTTTYAYNWAGDLSGVDYSDSTPDVAYDYDRRGRQIAIAQSGGTSISRTYNDAGQLLTESYSGGPLNGLAVTNGYDELLRRTNLVLLNAQGAVLASTAYSYDAASRLQTVSDGPHSASYQYLENSPLVAQITFATDAQTVMTTSKEYDALNRLTAIASHPGGTPPPASVSFAYSYNAANQRIRRAESDSSYWSYQYDALGQVISGKKYWADGTPVAGQQFEYAFDTIGNRRTNGFGGNEVGLSLRESCYTVNDLNQYTSRTVPGYVNILGEAAETACVSVNTNLAYRKGRYFRAELSVNNTANPVWLGITNLAVMPVGGGNYVVSNVTGYLLWPKTPETFTFDADGNLTSDSLWTNQWNGENRRTVIESRAGVLAAARRREQWAHLPDGRWIERIVSTNNGTAYYPAFTNRYVWDGQVLLAVLDAANNLVLSFMRGLDLSGAQAGPANMQGAGGVGGVLAVYDASTLNNQPSTHFACHDGNGSVVALVNAAEGTETARYEYGAFGEPLRMTGPRAKTNPIRFSTQYADDVTGDLKYLFRDYRADIGRWPNRDPIGELGFHLLRTGQQVFLSSNGDAPPTPGGVRDAAFGLIQELGLVDADAVNEFLGGPGGLNLYCLTGNDPLNFTDYLGLAPFCVCIRADDDHAWIWVKDLATGEVHTYGRWKKGYGRPAANKSGVIVDMEKNRGYGASRCIQVQDFKPTINEGYDLYNNNCATYAWSEWKRVSGENLKKSSLFGSGTYDHPSVLKDSINKANAGKKKSEDCCGEATK